MQLVSSDELLKAFAEFEKSRGPVPSHHNTIGMPIGSRLYRIQRVREAWMLWIATSNFLTGTFLMCYDNGKVERWTVRDDEGDEIKVVRPSDEEIIRDTARRSREQAQPVVHNDEQAQPIVGTTPTDESNGTKNTT